MIFAIAYSGSFYLKVDERPKGDYLARGWGPFRPIDRQTIKSSFDVPPEVFNDSEALTSCGLVRRSERPNPRRAQSKEAAENNLSDDLRRVP